jgi:adenylate cyclase
MTRRSVEMSQQMFQRAVALDASYGHAYAGLAEAAAMLALHYFSEGSGIDLALEHCARALEIDPRLAAAHAAKGRVLAVLGRSNEAERSFRTAIELDTRSHEAHLYLGVMRLLEGRASEALSGSVVPAAQRSTRRDDGVHHFPCHRRS